MANKFQDILKGMLFVINRNLLGHFLKKLRKTLNTSEIKTSLGLANGEEWLEWYLPTG